VEKLRNALRDVASENLEVLQRDVADKAHATTIVVQAVKKFARIDVVVNSAGSGSTTRRSIPQ
jgi:NADP-dependent 3-hydroxy acid dehydrogenase YdfG